MKRATAVFGLALVISLASGWAAASPLTLELFNSFSIPTSSHVRDGEATGGALLRSAGTGVEASLTSNVRAYAEVSATEPWNWDEDAKGEETIDWIMEFRLRGDEGASAELVGSYSLWLAYILEAVPDEDLYISGSFASAESWSEFGALLMPAFHSMYVDEWHVGDLVLWIGLAAGGLEEKGNFSLGVLKVNNFADPRAGEYVMMGGTYRSLALAEMAPWGITESWGLGNFSVRVDIKPLAPPEPPAEIPEAGTFVSAFSGVAALLAGRKLM